ncbi:MAG: hypothetical protein ACLRMJ_02845 [Alistipes finegoldii]
MRFKWGMEFSRPSCFLREIDPTCRADFDAGESVRRRGGETLGHRRTAPPLRLPLPAETAGRRRAAKRRSRRLRGQRRQFRPSADGESGPRGVSPGRGPRDARPQGRPDPALVQAPRPSTDGMRRIGVRQAADGGVPLGDTMPVSGDYTVGQRVEHPKFGVGIVQRIETLATDHKLVVAFDGAGEKTLLAKFAKLTKL